MSRDIEAVRAARRRWYEKNKEAEKAKALTRKKELIKRNQDYINAIKASPCTDCGVSYPYYVMDFDHLVQKDKTELVSVLMRKPATLEVIQAEIDKCELVCSNCHRARTHTRSYATGVPEA